MTIKTAISKTKKGESRKEMGKLIQGTRRPGIIITRNVKKVKIFKAQSFYVGVVYILIHGKTDEVILHECSPCNGWPLYNSTLRQIPIQCKKSCDRRFAIAFFWNANSQVKLVSLHELYWKNFKWKRSQKLEFCTKSKSTISSSKLNAGGKKLSTHEMANVGLLHFLYVSEWYLKRFSIIRKTSICCSYPKWKKSQSPHPFHFVQISNFIS